MAAASQAPALSGPAVLPCCHLAARWPWHQNGRTSVLRATSSTGKQAIDWRDGHIETAVLLEVL